MPWQSQERLQEVLQEPVEQLLTRKKKRGKTTGYDLAILESSSESASASEFVECNTGLRIFGP